MKSILLVSKTKKNNFSLFGVMFCSTVTMTFHYTNRCDDWHRLFYYYWYRIIRAYQKSMRIISILDFYQPFANIITSWTNRKLNLNNNRKNWWIWISDWKIWQLTANDLFFCHFLITFSLILFFFWSEQGIQQRDVNWISHFSY